MRRIAIVMLGLGGFLLAGCKSTTLSETFVDPSYRVQPKSMLVAYYLPYDSALLDNQRLANAVTVGLARCGVQARVVMRGGVSFDGFPAEFANSTTADVDAILVLSDASNKGARLAEAFMGGRRGEAGNNYAVSLFERKAMSRVWGSEINVHGSNGLQIYTTAEKSDNFAHALLDYLAADGVVSCPKAAG
ncbi:hypothetical protein [Magnetospirillum aberrantis]|uniref:DUF4136 domain-containing protein n=1 Tax=Magnetospirillum aberrantis SpK TaxID=908842 RepID=A0A7C9V0P8_9PROT|nr:hypothetical protein [Magnetospirillum aberrantis]NFV81311.1 hypothetical protein [Magnetospirillum aberrantis SpK]